jgi:uncharacterized protein YjcR
MDSNVKLTDEQFDWIMKSIKKISEQEAYVKRLKERKDYLLKQYTEENFFTEPEESEAEAVARLERKHDAYTVVVGEEERILRNNEGAFKRYLETWIINS